MSDREEMARLLSPYEHATANSRVAADAVWAAGWRKKPSRSDIVADLTRNRSGCGDSAITDNAFFAGMVADAILALMGGVSEQTEQT